MIDPSSRSWRAVARECRDKIEASRRLLEAPRLDMVQTEHERGRIRALREILALAEAAPDVKTADVVSYDD